MPANEPQGGGIKNTDAEIRDGVWSDSTKAPGKTIEDSLSVTNFGTYTLENYTQLAELPSEIDGQSFVGFADDGNVLVTSQFNGSSVTSIFLRKPYDPFAISTSSSAFLNSNYAGNPHGVVFNEDGTVMWIADSGAAALRQYSLSTPYDVGSQSFDGDVFLSSSGSSGLDLVWGDSGSKLYRSDGGDVIEQLSASTPYDANTLSYDGNAFLTDPHGFAFDPVGSHVIYADHAGETVRRESISTNWDITSGLQTAGSVTNAGASPTGLETVKNGTGLILTPSTPVYNTVGYQVYL